MPMTKLCKELIGQISKKWPEAELYFHCGCTMHEYEITVTYGDSWFITLSGTSGRFTVMLYMVTGSVKTCNRGYIYLKEYRIGKVQKEGQYAIKCVDVETGNELWRFYLSLSELIAEMERQIIPVNARNAGKLIGQGYKTRGKQLVKG